ncbi:hypothetical protein J27TS8_32790 [Robertmurraya siralis]|uniref:Uncharacterized protein n=1 Tax=Robertmurraya siralis TaxID=77777 RepID=A0A919WKB0_9BACI|nr:MULTISPECIES: hypothetical protein [Robertmurraya]MDF1510281.1 hypothetical protein [Robertmurraya sp. DFI.2.37]GIN63286.1 hypothetical protein J27TS8_32790 [Robertmurraya siralis]
MSRAFYDYGETSFSNYIWVKGKGTFYNPKLISFEKITDQSIIVECYDYNNNYQGKVVTATGFNWRSAELSWLPRGKSYRLKLVNGGSGTVRIKQGSVHYEDLKIA